MSAVGTARGLRLVREFGEEIHHARLAAGLSQALVATAAGITQSSISRMERGVPPFPDLVEAARVARVVGLDLSTRCFPAAGQLRDAAHLDLIRRLVARLGAGIHHWLEAPIGPDDQRAWDVLLTVGGQRIGVIAETRIRDLQALFRREHQKQLDSGVDLLLLLVADTKHNRAVLAEASAVLRTAFPLGTRTVLTQLARGEAPEANGIVFL